MSSNQDLLKEKIVIRLLKDSKIEFKRYRHILKTVKNVIDRPQTKAKTHTKTAHVLRADFEKMVDS